MLSIVGVVEIRTTFLAASCFPPSNQNDAFLFVYTRFSLSYSLSTSCRFSTSRRFVAASQRLIFRWKYRRRSSFFFSTPFESKENQEPWLLLFFQDIYSGYYSSLRVKSLPYPKQYESVFFFFLTVNKMN